MVDIILLFLFIFFTSKLLFLIFTYSTYHKYFFYSIPFLIIYSVFVGFLLNYFNIGRYFLPYTILQIIWLIIVWRIDDKKAKEQLKFVDKTSEDYLLLKYSMSQTNLYYLLSSLTYITSFIFAFLLILQLHPSK